jgi:hypothetical protein
MTDTDAEPSKAELIEKVEQLESEQQTLKSQLKRMLPSRRDALKAGAAATVGIGALGVASDSAESATGIAGTIGSASDRPDIFADEIDSIRTDFSQLSVNPNNAGVNAQQFNQTRTLNANGNAELLFRIPPAFGGRMTGFAVVSFRGGFNQRLTEFIAIAGSTEITTIHTENDTLGISTSYTISSQSQKELLVTTSNSNPIDVSVTFIGHT